MSLIAGMNDVIEYIKKIEEENKKLKEDYENLKEEKEDIENKLQEYMDEIFEFSYFKKSKELEEENKKLKEDIKTYKTKFEEGLTKLTGVQKSMEEMFEKIEEDKFKIMKQEEENKKYGVLIETEFTYKDIGYYDTLEEAKSVFKQEIEESPNNRIVIFLKEDNNSKYNIIEEYNNLPPEDVNFNPEDIGK